MHLIFLSLSFPTCKSETTIATDYEESLNLTIYVKDYPEPQIPF